MKIRFRGSRVLFSADRHSVKFSEHAEKESSFYLTKNVMVSFNLKGLLRDAV